MDEVSCPALTNALSISLWEDAPQPVLAISPFPDSTSVFSPTDEITILSSLDGPILKIYTTTLKMYEDLFGMEPHALHLAMTGDRSMWVGGGYQNMIELHDVTSGQRLLLGSAMVSNPMLTTEIFLTEGVTLQENQVLELYDSSETIQGVTFTVWASVPEVFGVTPTVAYAEDWVTLLGRNLPEEIDLYVGRWLVQTRDKTSTSICFEMPYLPDDGMTVNFMQAVVAEPWSGEEVQGSVCVRYLGKRPGANAWPIADAGIPQYALPGDWVTLDGSASNDDDGDTPIIIMRGAG